MNRRSPMAILRPQGNSYPFEERSIDVLLAHKVGRAVAKSKPEGNNAIFDCKVLSRNHALLWFLEGKFFIKDTSSSNGTFVNFNRLSPANKDSEPQEIHSNDIIQFGVEVTDTSSKLTHGCIIAKIKLYYPNGAEAVKAPSLFNNIPTLNMLPPYYSYTQMVEREKEILKKLKTIEGIIEEANSMAEVCWKVKQEEQELVKKLNDLQTTCDEKIKNAAELETQNRRLELKLKNDAILFELQEKKIKEKEKESESLRNELANNEIEYKKLIEEKSAFNNKQLYDNHNSIQYELSTPIQPSQKQDHHNLTNNICAMISLLIILLVVLVSYALTCVT